MAVGAGQFATSWSPRRPRRAGTGRAHPGGRRRIPIAFLTARLALDDLARLQPGERVLIHAAAGGVGLAAVALARRAGAEVFATAGSPEKRELLSRSGVEHVMDSRSLDFADEIQRAPAAAASTSSSTRSPASSSREPARRGRGGRFLEIGKRGIWTPGGRAARPDVAYHVLDLGDGSTREPARIHAMLDELATRVRRRAADAAAASTLFSADRAADAFRFMAQARHVGKLVVTQPARAAAARSGPTPRYLITGGLGALGLRTARWLVARGARHLVLMGRAAPAPEGGRSDWLGSSWTGAASA